MKGSNSKFGFATSAGLSPTQNPLIYVLINQHALQRVLAYQEKLARQPKMPAASAA